MKTASICTLLLPIIIGIGSSTPRLCHAGDLAPGGTEQFDRAEVETIRMHTRQILSDPALASRRTFWQWLSEKFSGRKIPRLNLGSGWATFIWSIIFIWCVLALVAILAHFIWTVRLLVWPYRGLRGTVDGSSSAAVKITSFEELYQMAQEQAEKGAFAEAISLLILALLRLLDSAGAIRFHESKTNGDYVREYPRDDVGRDEFRQFVLIFERSIYGSFRGDRQAYSQMNSLMEHIRSRVTQKA